MTRRAVKTSRPVSAFVLGMLATLAVVAGHVAGLDDSVELQALDSRFRNFPTAPPATGVLHVDIDDGSLAELGRWPWPREQTAGLVDTLRECGAAAVALDIMMHHPQQTRHVSAAVEVYSSQTARLVGREAQIVFDDLALESAFKDCPQILLAMHVSFSQPMPTGEQSGPTGGGELEGRVREILAERPDADFESVRKAILPDQPRDANTPQRDALEKAYLRLRAIDALKRLAVPREKVRGYPARTGVLIPPMVRFAKVIDRTGFVTYEKDADGVVRRIPLLVRSGEQVYPQFALSMAAWELGRRHGGGYEITADASAVTIRCDDGFTRVLPVDERGFMLINWMPRGEDGGGDAGPTHIPASAVAVVRQLEQSMRKHTALIRRGYLDLALSIFAPEKELAERDLLRRHTLFALYAEEQAIYERRIAAQVERQRAMLFRPAGVPPEPTELLRAEALVGAKIDAACRELTTELRDRENLEFYLNAPAPPAVAATRPATGSADEDGEYRRLKGQYDRRARRVLEKLDSFDRLREENERIRADISREVERLRTVVAGKICLVGSTATGAPDFVISPLDTGRDTLRTRELTPGVVVHANILNTILSDSPVHRPARAVSILVILLAGAAVSLIAATRPVLQGGPITLLIAGAYAAFNAAVVFGVWSAWLVLVAPLTAMLASFLIVTAYRQLTEERAKRRIRGIFAHAMSAELVDRLIEDPQLARLGGEKRVVSCFCSDLAGFTSLAERLGEQRTVRLLNRYFDCMTEVIQNRCGGYVNKFLGDGLLVLFGAPVTQADHAARAIRAAVECQRELLRLNAELAEQSERPVELACRIGVATGEVMVGNCGSTTRMDYTAIGDTVNLSSRLESANKHFATRILVAGETWRQANAREEYLARPLGQVVVVGRNEPVEVWDVLGPLAEADDDAGKMCEDFARAIGLYRKRRFAAAAELFSGVLKIAPEDQAAEIYLDLCRRHLASPPGDDWIPALRLAEK